MSVKLIYMACETSYIVQVYFYFFCNLFVTFSYYLLPMKYEIGFYYLLWFLEPNNTDNFYKYIAELGICTFSICLKTRWPYLKVIIH